MNACDRKHKGARNELIACAMLLSQGYEVFRNVSPHGEIDLIAFKDGGFFHFDVKAASRREDGSFGRAKLSERQIKMGVKPIYVLGDGSCFIDPPPETLREPQQCGHCGESFIQINNWQNYCSAKCRADAWKIKQLAPDKQKGIIYHLPTRPGKLLRETEKKSRRAASGRAP